MKLTPEKSDVIYIENETSPKAIKQSYNSKKYLYGIDKEQHDALVKKQKYACASCGDDATGAEHSLHVDHNHKTNEIRGLLCAGCNTALGWLHDDLARTEKLAKYLRKSGTGIFITPSK
jgi:ribosomal protein S27AE